MKLALPRAAAPLRGAVSLPGDKSLAHRACLFAALAEGVSEIRNFPDSGVARAMRGALETLGVPSTYTDGTLRLRGNGMRPFPNAGVTVPCGNSATTFRLLAGALAATGTSAVLDGSPGLRRRPMERIAEPLRQMGALVDTTDGHAPLRLAAKPLSSIDYALPVASAQVLSGIEIAALGATGETTVSVPGPVRDHTTRMLRAMGAEAAEEGSVTRVRGPVRKLVPLAGTLPGDISSAAFLFAAAALVPGSRVLVRDLCVNPGRTGFLDILRAMGAEVRFGAVREVFGEPTADVSVASTGSLRAVTVDGALVVRSIDEFPAIAALACFAEGETVVHEAAELRAKETDRIACLVTALASLGAEVREFPDGFSVRGGTLRGGTAQAYGDHRLAMALALLGLRADVAVEGAEILSESFPGFIPALESLRTDKTT